MEKLAVKNLSFTYPGSTSCALKNISFTVNDGDFITVCGASGSGKTTLLRMLKPSLQLHGETSGEVFFNGKSLCELSHREESETIGFVQQNPENQLVTDKVWHELAFGLESLGIKQNEIRRRVAETAAFFGMEGYFDHDVASLSGGQKQLLNLASVMAMQPEVLILDEPTSQLDPIAAAEFISCVCRINRELGTTVIMTEHRLEDVFPVSDKVLVLQEGSVLTFDSPEQIASQLEKNSEVTTFLPTPMKLRIILGDEKSACPCNIAQGRSWLKEYTNTHQIIPLAPEEIPSRGKKTLELQNIWFRYQKKTADVLKNLSLQAYRGELIAIMGGNGAGKSTLLSVINGINKAYSGKISVGGRCLLLPQNPQMLLSGSTLRQSLHEMADYYQNKDDWDRYLRETVSFCELEPLLDRHPFDLSGGETQRAALAKLLLAKPDILLLDEPTKGLDSAFKEKLALLLRSLTEAGVTVIVVSHDVEFCARYAHRCMMLFQGELVAEGTPREFFLSNSFYVTSARRIAKGILDDAVTLEDIIYCCTGQKQEPPPVDPFQTSFDDNTSAPSAKEKIPGWKKALGILGAVMMIPGVCCSLDLLPLPAAPLWLKILLLAVPLMMLMIAFSDVSKMKAEPIPRGKLSKRTIAAVIMILLAIPLTIFIGTTYLYDQKYLFISLLVLLECMLPFFLIFEGRKPQARELVLIAVMCAIAIAGRSVFIALPQVKPVLALVIISGIALGAESGFLVGAVTMLVSNIYFGQGAWTPWQMFAAGLIGFLAGIIIRKGLLRKSRGGICIFGFLATIFVYGSIMNFSAIILSRVPLTTASVLSFYIQGLPMDIIHALSTLLFLFFAAEPMLKKLDRIRIKYGLLS